MHLLSYKPLDYDIFIIMPPYGTDMEGNSTTLRKAKREMDRGLTEVMPDSWEGHGRLAIRRSDAIPMSIEKKAIAKVENLSDEKDATPKEIAELLIEKFAERNS